MRSAVVLASLCATLAIASPLKGLKKKAIVTDTVTEIVYVTITDGIVPSSTSVPDTTVVVQHTVYVDPTPETTSSSTTSTSTSTTPPPPPPTTSTTAAPPSPPTTTSTPEPAPAPTSTQEAAEVAPAATTQSPVVQEVTTTAAAAAVASPTDYISTALYHHNVHRANHSASDVTWDDTLASYALKTAQTCVFAHDMTEGAAGYGQNLAAYGTSSDISSLSTSSLVADAITNQWYYGEYLNMPYGQNSPSTSGPEFLHFSQLVWKSSTTIGCATVECAAGTIFSYASLYTVCDYGPEGNVLGEFATEVTPPIGNAGVTATIS